MRSAARLWLVGLALVLVGWPASAQAQQVQLVSKSVPPSDAAGVENGGPISMSADGKLVVYVSRARNLVPGQVDRDGTGDVFLFDLVNGTVTLVSHAAASTATTGDGESVEAQISADGAYVAFSSYATNLVAGQADGNSGADIFLWERASGTISLVSHAAGSPNQAGSSFSNAFSLSGDGAYVAFQSAAGDLVPGGSDANATEDVFLWSRVTGTTAFVSHVAGAPTVAATGFSSDPKISGDGSFVAFRSFAADVVAGLSDGNGGGDVFLFERATAAITLVSHVPGSATTTGNGQADSAVISGDGSYVAFASGAGNLVPGQVDSNGQPDVFLYQRASGSLVLVSHVAGSPVTTGGDGSSMPLISQDGSVVAFMSASANLVAGQVDANVGQDVFWFERASGSVFLASHSFGAPLVAAGAPSEEVALSPDGDWIAFRSAAIDVVGGQVEANSIGDVFLVQRTTATATLVSRRAGAPTTTGAAVAFSSGLAVGADGSEQRVGFLSGAWDLVAGVADHSGTSLLVCDAFLFERTTGTNTLASPSGQFSASAGGVSYASGPGSNFRSTTSSDGRYLVFFSDATNLVAGQLDGNGVNDVFLYDRVAGTVVLVSHRPGQPQTAANGLSGNPSISSDGRYVAFHSLASDLVAGQVEPTGSFQDVFLFERATGTVTLVSHPPGQPATTGNGASYDAVISGDGSWVAFTSATTNVVPGSDTNGVDDVMIYDRGSDVVRLVSHVPGSATTTGNARSYSASISDPALAGAVRVAFRSLATNLVAGQSDAAGSIDVFLYTIAPESMALVTAQAGTTTTAVGGAPLPQVLSADGNWVAYVSSASNLVSGQADAAGTSDVFLYDRASATNLLVSRQAATVATAANGASQFPAPSQDGRYVAFQSLATNLVGGVTDGNGLSDVFLFDRVSGTSQLVSRRAGAPSMTAGGQSWVPSVDGAGNRVVFHSRAGDLVAGQQGAGGFEGVFLYERATGSMLLASPTAGTSLRRGEGDAQQYPFLSRDGAYAFYSSLASDLVTADFNQATDVFQFQPLLADLRVTKDDAGATSAFPGAAISYTITVTNNGPTGVNAVDLFDTLPSELVTPSFLPSAGGYDQGSGLWDGFTLPPLGSITMTLMATIDPAATGTLTNTVTVSGRGIADPQPSDNSASDVDTLTPSADLVVLKSDSPDPVPTGGNLVYTIVVRNDGPSTATGVTLSDTLPAGVTFLSVTPGSPTCSHSAGTVSCAFAAVAPGAGGIQVVAVEVLAPGGTGSIVNTATVSSATSDPDLLDNTVNEPTQVTTATDTIQFFTVTSTDQRNVLEWRTPMTGLETVVRYNKAATGDSACADPTATVGTQLVAPGFVPNANQFLVHDTPALENDTTYCYGIFVRTSAVPTFSAGRFARGRPFATGPVLWAFSTGATSVAPPTVGTTAAFVVSNDRALYAIQRGPGGGRWLVGPGPYVPFRMTKPAQARSPWVPTTAVPGATQVVFVGSQDGTVYAIDAVSGGGAAAMPLWQSPPLTGGVVLAAPAGIFQDFGATLDRVLVGSWNSSGPSAFASLRTTDGGVENSFSDPNLGIVSGMAAVAYPDRVYFTSHTFGGGTRSLWCLTLTPAFGSCAAWSGVPAGEVETSPVLRGGRIYLGDTSGVMRAFRESDGAEEWSFATLDGGVKGFVFPDRASGDLFFSTTSKVWGVNHVSGAGTKLWEASLSAGALPSAALFAPGTKRVYVGGSDGSLYELDFTSATLTTPPTEKRVKLGDGAALVGAPSLDRGFDLIYVGSEAGVIYAVSIPFP